MVAKICFPEWNGCPFYRKGVDRVYDVPMELIHNGFEQIFENESRFLQEPLETLQMFVDEPWLREHLPAQRFDIC